MEQTVERPRRIKSDLLLYILVLVFVFSAYFVLSFLEFAFERFSTTLQFVFFAILLVLCYVLLMRRLTTYRYVLTDTDFTVFRSMGRREKPMEQIPLHQIMLVAPYPEVKKGEKGREHALCVGKKKDSIVVVYSALSGRKQWLIVSIHEKMRAAVIEAAKKDALRHAQERYS